MTELMGGSIEVESEEGVGTTFTIHLGFQRASARESTPALAVREFLPMKSCRVLVVDDNPVNRLVACKMLDVLGHEAEEATDGKDALTKLGAAHFDVVLMDVHMPVVNGVAATRELRATDGPNREVPVVALTADAVATNKELCREVGMDGFLSKPFSTEDLDLAIREALQHTQ